MGSRSGEGTRRGRTRANRADEPWNPRESDLPSPAIFAGSLGLVTGLGVWLYAAVLWVRGEQASNSQHYLLTVLAALADFGLAPSLIGAALGLAGVVRRGVSRRWRWRAGMGLILGLTGLAVTIARLLVTSGSSTSNLNCGRCF